MNIEYDLYQEIIMEHYRAGEHRGIMQNADASADGNNPACGDKLSLYIQLRDRHPRADSGSLAIKSLSYDGEGCAICCASANMICEFLAGHTVDQARDLTRRFRAMVLENAPPPMEEEFEDLAALQGVRLYPMRVKCALLSWNALDIALNELSPKK